MYVSILKFSHTEQKNFSPGFHSEYTFITSTAYMVLLCAVKECYDSWVGCITVNSSTYIEAMLHKRASVDVTTSSAIINKTLLIHSCTNALIVRMYWYLNS
jgi:hypothetical protein